MLHGNWLRLQRTLPLCTKWVSNFQCSCYRSFLYLCQLISSLILLLLQLASPQNRRGWFTCYSQYPLTDCQGSKHMPSISLYLLQLWFNFLKYLYLHLQGWEQTIQMETSGCYRRECDAQNQARCSDLSQSTRLALRKQPFLCKVNQQCVKTL